VYVAKNKPRLDVAAEAGFRLGPKGSESDHVKNKRGKTKCKRQLEMSNSSSLLSLLFC
jgi:hypothetical protein